MRRKFELKMEEVDEMSESLGLTDRVEGNTFSAGLVDGFHAVAKLLPWLIFGGLILLFVC